MRITNNRILALAASLFMAAAMAFATPPRRSLDAARATKVKRHQATGEILSVSATTLVLLHARGRARQRMTFHLTPQTKESVVVTGGRRVTVIYILSEGRMDAVRIRAPKTRKR